jgi:hypothetical protein
LYRILPYETSTRDLDTSSNIAYRRQREIRDLETLLLEVRLKRLRDLIRSGRVDESQRENINELMKTLAQMKATGRYIR